MCWQRLSLLVPPQLREIVARRVLSGSGVPRARAAARDSFVLLGSRDGRDGSLQIHQDVDLWMTLVHANDSRVYSLGSGRHAWIHVARGEAVVNDIALAAGDGLAITAEPKISVGGVLGRGPAEILLFDLA